MTRYEELKLLCEKALGDYFEALNIGEEELISKRYEELLCLCKKLELVKMEEMELNFERKI